MAKAPNWSKEELSVLYELYPELGPSEELLSLLPEYRRNANAVSLKASRLGITYTKNIRKGCSEEEYIESIKDSNFILIGKYVNKTTATMHKCKNCGCEREIRPQQILRGSTYCSTCSNNPNTLSIDTVDEVLSIAGFTRLSEYTGSMQPIKLIHNYCGYEWTTKYSYIEQGSGCPSCNKGFGYNQGNTPEKAFLYLLEIILWGGSRFLKVGVTAKDINRRVSSLIKDIGEDLLVIKPLCIVTSSGSNILNSERQILDNFKKYIHNKVFPGYTELLDTSEKEAVIQYIENLKYDKVV